MSRSSSTTSSSGLPEDLSEIAAQTYEEEEVVWRSVCLSAPAAPASTLSDVFDLSEQPVYRSVSCAPAAAASPLGLGSLDLSALNINAATVEQNTTTGCGQIGQNFAEFADVPVFRSTKTATRPTTLTAGFPVEHSHFISTASVEATVEAIQSCCDASQVSTTYKAAKHKFSCSVLLRNSAVRFVVRLFTTARGETLVEFQRRSGCVMQWSSVLAAAHAGLGAIMDADGAARFARLGATAAASASATTTTDDSGAAANTEIPRGLAPPPLGLAPPTLSRNSVNFQYVSASPVTANSEDPLVDMVRDVRADVRAEASRAVANMPAAEVAASPAIVAALSDALAAGPDLSQRDLESERCAVTALANLAESGADCASLAAVAPAALAAASRSLADDRIACPLYKRECARAVEALRSVAVIG